MLTSLISVSVQNLAGNSCTLQIDRCASIAILKHAILGESKLLTQDEVMVLVFGDSRLGLVGGRGPPTKIS